MYTRKNGTPWARAQHKCRKCGVEVDRSGVVPVKCAAYYGDKFPTLEKRRSIWKSCAANSVLQQHSKSAVKTAKAKTRAAAKTASKRAGGIAAAKRGARGARVGEAVHPVPDRLPKRHTKEISKKVDGCQATGCGLRAKRVGEADHPGPDRFCVGLKTSGLGTPTVSPSWKMLKTKIRCFAFSGNQHFGPCQCDSFAQGSKVWLASRSCAAALLAQKQRRSCCFG